MTDPLKPRPTRVRYTVLAVLCSLAFLTYLDRFCVARVQDEIAADLRFGDLGPGPEAGFVAATVAAPTPLEAAAVAEARRLNVRAQTLQRQGWLFSAFLLGYLLLEVPAGWLGDRWGARAVLAAIVAFWSLFTLLTGFSDRLIGLVVERPEPWLLVGGVVLVRFLVGAGEAGAFPNVSRVVGTWFPLRERAAATGVVWMCTRLGGALTFVITGALVDLGGGWRPAFAILGVVGLLWAVAFAVAFRDRPDQVAAVNAAERDLIGTGAADAHGHAPGTPWRRILLSGNLWGFYLTAAAISYAWYFYGTFLPKYLDETYPAEFRGSHWADVVKGLPFLVGAAGCLIGGRLSDVLVRRYGRRWGRSGIGVAGFLIAAVCIVAAYHTGSGWGVVTLVCVACFIQDLAVPVMWAVPIDVGGRYAATVAGVMNCVGGLGGASSPVMVAYLAGHLGWEWVFYAAGAVYLLGGLLWLGVDASKSVETAAG
jgi:MFS family permease